ncbi:MAG TPA: hypothetical protein VFG16_05425, partial [Streptomyces sp.]|nr:hypothetical protein [Streptomyces sp.]
MSHQGERPATEDDWWNRLYDASAPDTGPAARAGDTLDDRFDSAADAVAADDASEPREADPEWYPEPDRAPDPVRPRAWWETHPADVSAPAPPAVSPAQVPLPPQESAAPPARPQ